MKIFTQNDVAAYPSFCVKITLEIADEFHSKIHVKELIGGGRL
jgi:hypothetical protein